MKLGRLLCAVLLLSLAVSVCFAADRGPSTPEERARAVEIARKTEADPLNKGYREDVRWLLLFATQVPDITIKLCSNPIYDLPKNYKYAPELTMQVLASSLTFVIEHPDKAKDDSVVCQAGLEGALRAYENILKQDPKARVEKLDELIQTRNSTGLPSTSKR